MNWTEQTQTLLRSWTETHKKLWEEWGGAAQPSGPSGSGSWGEWLKRWQESARQGVSALPPGAASLPREVLGRLFAGEQVFAQFTELALGVLKNIAPNLDAGDDWADLMRRQLAQLKEEMTRTPAPWYTPEAAATMARDLPELWRLYQREAEKMAAPWFHAVREARGHLGEAAAGDGQAAIRMFNVFMDTFETSVGKLTAAPAIGYTRELQEKIARAFETWVDVRRAELEFRTELVGAGFRALEGLVRELVEVGERGEKIESFRALFDLWVTAAEKTYFEIASTDSFAEIQGRLVNTAMQYRIRERDVADTFLKGLHVPTRREVDEAYRHLHELRAEVRALRAELVEWKAGALPDTPTTGVAVKGAPRKRSARPARKEG